MGVLCIRVQKYVEVPEKPPFFGEPFRNSFTHKKPLKPKSHLFLENYSHVLGECHISHHPHLRAADELFSPRERALGLLNAQPHEMLFAPAARVALAIERESKRFWEQAG